MNQWVKQAGFVAIYSLMTTSVYAGPVDVTLLHTNDLHSHFRSDKSVLDLGGVARLKTAIDRDRKAAAHSLLVDGGDWSEGNIYYTLGAGLESIRMLDHLGYDVAVVGNHDWLNGADNLLNTIELAQTRVSFVSANLKTDDYGRADEFNQHILPYTIREVGGVRIAFIGLSTYEKIYDQYLKPVLIEDPVNMLEDLAATLKTRVDAVVVISHNSISNNEKFLKNAPSVDLVIGAHDHVKLVKPVIVERGDSAPPAWIVEAGCWGMYLGKLKMRITPHAELRAGAPAVELLSEELEQMDSTVPENSEILKIVENLEGQISAKRGRIFDDRLGESQIELSGSGTGMETMIGNFVTDAYRDRTHADAALDQVGMIYGELHPGQATTSDVFNADPGVYSPKTNLSWTLHLLPINGERLNLLLNTLFTSQSLADLASVATSGMKITYDPIFNEQDPFQSAPFRILQAPDAVAYILIQGQPIDAFHTYQLAVGGGIIEAFKFMNQYVPGIVPLDQMTDLGVEDWRVVADYFREKSPITLKTVDIEGRYQSKKADLAVYTNDLTWKVLTKTQDRAHARVQVRIRNLGLEASQASAQVRLWTNLNGTHLERENNMAPISEAQSVSILNFGESQVLSFDVDVPGDLGIYGVTARITGNEEEINHLNDEATRYFKN